MRKREYSCRSAFFGGLSLTSSRNLQTQGKPTLRVNYASLFPAWELRVVCWIEGKAKEGVKLPLPKYDFPNLVYLLRVFSTLLTTMP